MTDEVWKLIEESDMLLIGIGSELALKEDNKEKVDRAYAVLAQLLKGRNYFVITGNTDGKIKDGTLLNMLTAAPRLDGEEKQWDAYMKWLSCSLSYKLTILELGEGFSNAGIMRWPFERVVMVHQKSALIRVHSDLYQVPAEISTRSYPVKQSSFDFIEEIAERLK